MAVAEQVEVENAAVAADRDPERDPAGRSPQPPDPVHRRRHQHGGPAGALGRGGLGEEEEGGVAAPLQQVRPVGGGHAQHLGEDRADDVGDLLRPDLAPGGQPLGEGREPRDVHEQQGALEAAVDRLRRAGEPVQGELRQIGRDSAGGVNLGCRRVVPPQSRDPCPPRDARLAGRAHFSIVGVIL